MKVAVVYNKPDKGKLDSVDILDQLGLVTAGIAELGFEFREFPVEGKEGSFVDLVRNVSAFAPDAIFNLFEGLQDDPRFQPVLASFYEIAGIPYTGAFYEGLLKTTDKTLTKSVLDANNLPTPPWQAFYGNLGAVRVPSPWILKPSWEDGSVGITDSSVISSKPVLFQKLPLMYEAHRRRPLLVENYIDGREFNIPLYQHADGRVELLPPSEILFESWPAGKPKIMNYNSKWEENSFEYENTQRSYECQGAPVDTMQELALKCWDIFDLRGYARVDMRLAESGEVWIIEINANPCITPTSGYIGAVEEAGYTPKDFVRDMLGVAVNVRR